MSFIHSTAELRNSEYGNIKVYRNVVVSNSVLESGVSVGDDSVIERCTIKSNVAVNRRNYINDSTIGEFSYTGINTIINWSNIGKFCSIGRNVDIGGVNHDYRKITTMTQQRLQQMTKGEGVYLPKEIHEKCNIGNDVWIASGVNILNRVKIGDGAVIGAGAVVTKDVPPYAIVIGIPGKVVGYRCEEKLIPQMLKIQWWNWPSEILEKNIEYILNNDINESTIEHLLSIALKIDSEKGKTYVE